MCTPPLMERPNLQVFPPARSSRISSGTADSEPAAVNFE
jgi:hypothetical protein